eukprot:8605721-Pyramimonas_sp.AAC.1
MFRGVLVFFPAAAHPRLTSHLPRRTRVSPHTSPPPHSTATGGGAHRVRSMRCRRAWHGRRGTFSTPGGCAGGA